MYEQPVSTSTVTSSLQSSNNTAFQDTVLLNEIIALTTSTTGGGTDTTVTVSESTAAPGTTPVIAANTELALITVTKSVTAPDAPVVFTAASTKNVPVLVIQGDANVEMTLDDGAVTGGPVYGDAATGATVPATGAQRVVVAGAGNSKFTINDAKNTKLTLGTGNSTVVTGKGTDTVVAGLGNSTITGGNSDYSVVKLAGGAANYTVTSSSGHAMVTDKTTGKITDITKIQFVEVAGTVKTGADALIFAKNAVEASIAIMYEAAFGRTADANGLDYFFDAAKDGATLKQIADAFVKAPESAGRALLDDRTFVNSMYQNLYNRDGETGGMDFWLTALHDRGATRADVVKAFAEIYALNLQNLPTGAGHETTLIGNITIVGGII